jgi:hydroxymethylpyrimidine pyrophosphatase-like HAD family hydrolase
VESYCCGPVTKLLLLGPPEVVLPLQPRVVEAFGERITMIRTDRELLQIMASGISKAGALETIAQHYGIALAQTLAIGDGENDIEMLCECGVGVAVCNADPRVKQVARWVSGSANSHGVLESLRRYVPGLS